MKAVSFRQSANGNRVKRCKDRRRICNYFGLNLASFLTSTAVICFNLKGIYKQYVT